MKKIILCILCFFCFQQLFSINISYNPPVGKHPRVLFTQMSMPVIISNLQNDECLSAKNKMSDFLMYEPSTVYYGDRYDGRFVQVIETFAFQYVITKNSFYSKSAYEMLINCFNTIEQSVDKVFDKERPFGELVFAAAEVYDWCYESLSSSQKKIIIKYFYYFAKKFCMGWPPVKQNAVNGHGCEAQLLKNFMAFGIATFDEEPDIWNIVSSRFYSEYVPIRDFLYNSGLPSFQGNEYASYRAVFDLWSHLLITGMGGKPPFGDKIKEWSHSFLYYKLPGLKKLMPIGDCKLINEYNYNPYGLLFFLSSVVSSDPYAKYEADVLLNGFSEWKSNDSGEDDTVLSPVVFVIFNDASLKKKNPDQLPLVKYFPSPYGGYLIRGSWKDPQTPIVHMKIGEYYTGGHEHRDAGSFSIVEGDNITVQSGFYTSGAAYSSDFNKIFYQGTYSQNSILIDNGMNEDEQKKLPAQNFMGSHLNLDLYKRAEVLSHFDSIDDKGVGIAYISGDLKNCYEKVDICKRQMLTIFTGDEKNKLLFFIFDTIKTKNNNGNGVFVLQCPKEPETINNSIIYGDYKTITLNALLPEDLFISKIGGEERYSIVNKILKPDLSATFVKKQEKLANWGRVEIRSKSKNKDSEYFFNVISTSESKNKLYVDIKLIEEPNYYGCIAGKYFICFVDENAEKIKLNIPDGQDNIQLILCNIRDGIWKVEYNTVNAVLTQQIEVNPEEKLLRLATINSKQISITLN